jgi:hypothetical protein
MAAMTLITTNLLSRPERFTDVGSLYAGKGRRSMPGCGLFHNLLVIVQLSEIAAVVAPHDSTP